MTDREKVLNGLACCMHMDGNTCRKCPYAHECEDRERMLSGAAQLAADALALLKAQEPQKIRCVRYLVKVMKGICPSCEMEIESVIHGKLTKFCKFCGQAVKWE